MSCRTGTVASRPALARVLRLAACALLCTAPAAQAETQWTHFGGRFKLVTATPIAELARHPERYFNRQVRIVGVIASACTNEGCFIEVVPEDGEGDGVLVNFPEVTSRFPAGCAGARAIVEGMYYRKVYPASRVLHWQGHSFRAGKPVPDFSLLQRISASAVEITRDRGAPPSPGEIVRAQTDRIDLAAVEFEAEGFGAGRKHLQPGDSTGTHGTGDNREIVLCLKGTLTVIKPESPPVVLHPGEMTYIPPETQHALKNLSHRPAAYVFVFSRRPEPGLPHKH
jgi:quercetin dioxygenase-like cupin family protein